MVDDPRRDESEFEGKGPIGENSFAIEEEGDITNLNIVRYVGQIGVRAENVSADKTVERYCEEQDEQRQSEHEGAEQARVHVEEHPRREEKSDEEDAP